MATDTTSLYDLILKLLRDPHALADFQANPDAYLSACGDFSAADVKDAIDLARDDEDHTSGKHAQHTHVTPAHNPPEPESGEGSHEAAVKYLTTYITNNYNSTNIDNSVNQQVDTHGGDFDQTIDVHPTNVTGTGAVGIGGDNHGPVNTGEGGVAVDTANGPIVTGDGNQVGDGNVSGHGNVVGTGNAVGTGNVAGTGNQVVHGDGNTTSFGEGSAHSTTIGDGNTVNVDHGGVFGSGNTTTNTDSNNQTTDSHDTDTRVHVDDSFNTHDDHTITDSHDSETHTTVHDSGNDSSDSSTHDNHSTHDSHDTDLHL